MLPRGYCVHSTPTRVRIKVPERRGDAEFFARVQENLATYHAVGGAEVNPSTGSVLLIHLGDVRAIAAHAAEKGLFRLDGSCGKSLGRRTMATTAKGMFTTLDDKIQRVTGGDLNLADTAFLALVAGGIYQIARGNFAAPAWYTAFWYGLNIFLKAEGTRDAGADPHEVIKREGAGPWQKKERGKKSRRPEKNR